MSELIKVRVQLPHGSDPTRGPGWTDLLVREGTPDEDVIQECFVLDVYHLRGMQLRPTPPLQLDARMPDAWTPRIIDLGACTGIFSALALQMFPKAHVIAVEPNVENFGLLRQNTAKWNRVETIHAAVGADNRPLIMAGSGATGYSMHMTDSVTNPDNVDQVTLEQVIAGQPVALLKCLDADTRVPTRHGCIPIAEIEPGDEVWRDGRWRLVQAMRRSPRREGIELVTSAGRSLRLTPEHRLWSDGRWTEARDLTLGSILATTEAAPSESSLQRAPWPPMHRVTRHGSATEFASAPDAPQVEITERWGRVLGLFAGDGSCSARNRVQIACDGQDQDLIDSIVTDFRAIGLAPGTENVRMRDGTVLRRRTINVASAQLVRFLISLGVAEWREPTATYARRVIAIPEVIWRSPRGVLSQFLAGLFEADGSVSAKSSAVTLATKSPEFAREVQLTLSLLGIEANVRAQRASQSGPYADRFYSIVRLRRAAVEVFAKEVGFLSDRKRERLQQIIDRPAGANTKPQRWFEEVVSMQPCTVDPVDIQVDGEVFAAAGFVSHNCDVEGAEYATLDACPIGSMQLVDRIAMEWHGPEMAPWAHPPNANVQYGDMLHKLAYTHAVTVFGDPDRGGMLYAHRYDQ